MSFLKRDLLTWKGHRFYRQCLDLIIAILERDALLLPKIRGMMTISSAELDLLHDGRMALAGYAAPTVDQRGLRGVG